MEGLPSEEQIKAWIRDAVVEAQTASSDRTYYLEIWKKTVDVQQHFNDLELRIRNLAVTVLGAILSLAAFSVEKTITIKLYERSVPVAVLLIIVALITWGAFYLMDRHWYHRLLIGAVKHGLEIEKLLPGASLTKAIGDESPIRIGGRQIRSTNKMDLFYSLVGAALIVLIPVLLFGKSLK
ncbi:MAG TPA: hypothetical protein VE863_17230 [Pyrinomonadaceae bacterium]|jgi:hypothetical protein|nr:hypothetical protein [Pyrinomonadaceae bacterium]